LSAVLEVAKAFSCGSEVIVYRIRFWAVSATLAKS